MPKKLIKRYLPDSQDLKNHKHLKIFGHLLHNTNLWHLNRRSVSGAFAVGLFCAFIPVPFQMLIAAAGAIAFRVNLPISVALVWITNPITIPPMFYFSYLVGAWALGEPVTLTSFELSGDWLANSLAAVWEPFLLGCAICGVIASLLGYFAMRLFWRYHVIHQWKRRQLARQSQ